MPSVINSLSDKLSKKAPRLDLTGTQALGDGKVFCFLLLAMGEYLGIYRPKNKVKRLAGDPQAPTLRPGGRPRHPGLWAPWTPFALGLSPIYSHKFQKKSGDHRKYFSAAASFYLRKIPSGARSGALPEGRFGHGGLLHQHHVLSADA